MEPKVKHFIFIVLGISLFGLALGKIGDHRFDCSGLEQEVSSSLNTCLQLEKEKDVEHHNFVLEHQREANRHCEEIAKLGKKCVDTDWMTKRVAVDCGEVVKKAVCKARL